MKNKYFEFELDLKTSYIIATANDESLINPIIRDRMQIIKINSYSTYSKIYMVKEQILKKALSERSLPENILYLPCPKALGLIFSNFLVEVL